MARLAIYGVIARGIAPASDGALVIEAPYSAPFSLDPRSEDNWQQGRRVFVGFENEAHAIISVYDDDQRDFILSCAIVAPDGAAADLQTVACKWGNAEYQIVVNMDLSGTEFRVYSEGVHKFRFHADGDHLIDIPYPVVIRYDPSVRVV